MTAEKEVIIKKIVGWDEAKSQVILEGNQVHEVSEKVLQYKDTFKIGEKYKISKYGDPMIVRYITVAKDEDIKSAAPSTEDPKVATPMGKEEGWVLIQGKKYATLKVLLNKAHQMYKGNWSYKFEILHIDYEKKSCVVKATVFTENQTFDGIGDVTKENVDPKIGKSWIRMAETRAFVRALRWMTNIAEASVEELPGDEAKGAKEVPAAKKTTTKKKSPAKKSENVSEEDIANAAAAATSDEDDLGGDLDLV